MRQKLFIILLPLGMALLMSFIGFKVLSHQAAEVVEVEEEPLEVELIEAGDYREETASIIASGEVEALEEVTLSARISSQVEDMNYEVGDWVDEGDVLLSFDTDIYNIQLAQAAAAVERAKANLDIVLAGATDEQIRQAAAAVAQAEAGLAQAEAGYEQTKLSAQASIDTAEKSLESAEINLDNDLVEDTYESTILSMQSIYSSMQDFLNDADSILGIDDRNINDDFERALGVGDIQALNDAKIAYERAKESVLYDSDIVQDLEVGDSDQDDVEDAGEELEDSILLMQELFEDLKDVMQGTSSFSGLSQTELDAFRAMVSTNLSALNGYESTILTLKQSIEAAQDTMESYELAYESAELSLDQAKDNYDESLSSANASLESAQAAVDAAEAAYDATVADPRSVDTAPYYASIHEAAAAYQLLLEQRSYAFVTAPISGQIASIEADEGEFVGAGQALFTLVNTEAMEVKANISYRDVDRIEEGMTVRIEGEYEGDVIAISPSINASTKKVEVRIALKDPESFVAGQFVKVEFFADSESENFLLPLAAVKTNARGAFVYTVKDGIIKEIEVELGEVSGSKIEIESGLNEDDEIISSVRGLEAGQAVTTKS